MRRRPARRGHPAVMCTQVRASEQQVVPLIQGSRVRTKFYAPPTQYRHKFIPIIPFCHAFCSCRGHDDTILNRPCPPMKRLACTSRRHTRSRDVKRWSIMAALGKKQSGSAPVSIPSGGLPK